jgi:hypothetical protein
MSSGLGLSKSHEAFRATNNTVGQRRSNVWIRAMLLAFLLNGLYPFGLRILARMGVSQQYISVYLFTGTSAVAVLDRKASPGSTTPLENVDAHVQAAKKIRYLRADC